MVRRSTLQKSGLFDLAFNYGARADADLGMRLYLTGARMILDPGIAVLHHHAPRGGLRLHNARVITYASSRKHLIHRNLPGITELYLSMRYFTPNQVKETLWLAVLGTFSSHRSRLHKILKLIISLGMLHNTIQQLRVRRQQAKGMLQDFPQIPVWRDL